jgi:hypothetical protein
LHDGSYLLQRAKLFAYVNNIQITWKTVGLRIDIDYQLNFNYHIKNICRKASQQLNVLKRIGCFLSKVNKLTIFHTFILSNFNFCPLAWHFCNKSNTSKLEKNPGEGFTIYIRGL